MAGNYPVHDFLVDPAVPLVFLYRQTFPPSKLRHGGWDKLVPALSAAGGRPPRPWCNLARIVLTGRTSAALQVVPNLPLVDCARRRTDLGALFVDEIALDRSMARGGRRSTARNGSMGGWCWRPCKLANYGLVEDLDEDVHAPDPNSLLRSKGHMGVRFMFWYCLR
jgi:hypothetical protein